MNNRKEIGCVDYTPCVVNVYQHNRPLAVIFSPRGRSPAGTYRMGPVRPSVRPSVRASVRSRFSDTAEPILFKLGTKIKYYGQHMHVILDSRYDPIWPPGGHFVAFFHVFEP